MKHTKKRLPLIRRVLGNQRGGAMIEASIAFPVLFIFLLGLFEAGFIMWGNAMLSNVLNEAARKSTIGCPQQNIDASGACIDPAGVIDRTFIDTMVTDRSNGLLDPALLCLRAAPIDSVGTNPLAVPDGVNLGDGKEIVVFYMKYKWPIVIGLMQNALGSNVTFEGYTVVRNEDFALAASRTGGQSGPC